MAIDTELPRRPDVHYNIKCLCEPWTPRSRNLVVCIDGTSNQFSKYNTNVVEIHSRILKDSFKFDQTGMPVNPSHGATAIPEDLEDIDEEELKSYIEQLTYYSSGIGTYAGPSYLSFASWRQWAINKIDLAIAWNFANRVQTAYRWLVDHYRPGDRLFFFGFSRGAYQVRTLAAMIQTVGLLYSGNKELVPFAYELYCNGDKSMTKPFKKTFSRRRVRVHFIGAWDTVSSIGVMRGNPLPLANTSKHICFFRHALALDECRVKFVPEFAKMDDMQSPKSNTIASIAQQGAKHGEAVDTKTDSKPGDNPPGDVSLNPKKAPSEAKPKEVNRSQAGAGQSGSTQAASKQKSSRSLEHVKEVWFAGSHSDIGGGNSENLTLDLESVPLVWMEHEATLAGLELKPRDWVKTIWDWDHLRDGKLTNSLTWHWWPLEFVPFNISEFVRYLYNFNLFLRRLPLRSLLDIQKLPWVMHLGRGRDIGNGQLIHASLAFRKPEYIPKASFLASNFKWDNIIGKGSIEDLSWSRGLENILEMDVFDTTSALAHVVEELQNEKDEARLVSSLNRLYFIALSADGAAAIRHTEIILHLIRFLESDSPSLYSSCANCIAQVAKYGLVHTIPGDQNVSSWHAVIVSRGVPRLAAMLKNSTWGVVLSSVQCLSYLANFEDESSEGFVSAINDSVRNVFVELDPISNKTLWRTFEGKLSALPSNESDLGALPRYLHCFSRLIIDATIREKVLTSSNVVSTLVESFAVASQDDTASSKTEDVPRKSIIRAILNRFLNLKDEKPSVKNTQDLIPVMAKRYILTSLSEWLRHYDVRYALWEHVPVKTLAALTEMLKSKEPEFRHAAITYLPDFAQYNHEGRKEIAKTDVIPEIVRDLSSTRIFELQRDSVACLYRLVKYEDLRDCILNTNIIVELAKMLKSEDDNACNMGAEYLYEFVYDDASALQILKTDAIDDLATMLKTKPYLRRLGSAGCLGSLAPYKPIRDAILASRNSIVSRVTEMIADENEDTCGNARFALSQFANYDDMHDQLAAVTVPDLLLLLQDKNPIVRFNAATYNLWSSLKAHATLRTAMLKVNLIQQLVNMIQEDVSLVVRLSCSFAFWFLLGQEDLRAAALQLDSVAVFTKLLENTESAISLADELAELGRPKSGLNSLSGLISVVDVAATALCQFGQYEDATDTILRARSIEAVTERLLRSDDYELQDLGAQFVAGCAKDGRARVVILQVDAIEALGTLSDSDSDDVKKEAERALTELSEHEETRAAVEYERQKRRPAEPDGAPESGETNDAAPPESIVPAGVVQSVDAVTGDAR